MSWEIRFYDAKTMYSDIAIPLHTITDALIDIDLDPQSITGVDYFSQESRNCKVTLLNDYSPFMLQNLIETPEAIEVVDPLYKWIDEYQVWKYGIVLLRDDNIIYKGWTKLSNIEYSMKDDIIKITFFDVIGLIAIDEGKDREFTGNWTVPLSTMILTALNENHLLNIFNITASMDYSNVIGIPASGQIDLEDYAHNWDKFNNPDEDDFWYFYAYTSSGGNLFSGHIVDKVIYVGEKDSGYQIILQKHEIGGYLMAIPDIDDTLYLYEGVKQLDIRLDSNCSVTNVNVIDQILVEPHPEFSGNPSQMIEEWLTNKPLYNYLANTEIIQTLSYEDSENHIWLDNADDLLEINFETTIFLNAITVTEGEHNSKTLLKMYLLLNNLYILPTLEGITIKNKYLPNDSVGREIEIDNVLEYDRKAVTASHQDYSSAIAPLDYANKEAFIEAIEKYYNENAPKIEYDIDIIKDVELTLHDKINVNNKDMYICSIEEDNDGFVYLIKGWE